MQVESADDSPLSNPDMLPEEDTVDKYAIFIS